MALYSTALICGALTYLGLCKRPLPGDVWLGVEFLAGVVVYITRVRYFSEVWTLAAQHSALAIILQITGLVLSAVLYRLSPFHPLAEFPGPFLCRITSLKMVQMVMSGTRFRQLVDLHEEYGTFVRTGPNTLSINSNEAVQPIYAAANAWNKSRHYFLGSLPGHGLFWIQDKDQHNVRKRHFWTPAFNKISVYYPILDNRTDILLETIKDRGEGESQSVDMSLYMQYWAHDVTGDMTFGDAYEGDLIRDNDPLDTIKATNLQTQGFEITGEVPSLSDFLWYLPMNLMKIFRDMDERSNKFLDLRRSKGSLQPDLMSHLLNENPQLPKLTDDDLRREITLAIAGGTNGKLAPSTTITFGIYFLGAYPKVRDQLKEELLQAFPRYKEDGYIDHQVISNLPYLNAVVDETIRLGAPVGALSRVAPKGGAFVCGKFIPEDTIVSVPPYAQMISPENFYPLPLEFKPERWLPGGLGPGTKTNRNAIMAFSHGPFGCIGKSLAYQQLRIVLGKMVLTYDYKLAPEFDSKKFVEGVRNLRTVNFEHPLRIVLA